MTITNTHIDIAPDVVGESLPQSTVQIAVASDGTNNFERIMLVDANAATNINPVSESSPQELVNMVYLLRSILKVLESNANVDLKNNQRVNIDRIGPATDVGTTLPIAGTVTVGAVTAGVAMGTSYVGQGPVGTSPLGAAAALYQPIWEGPVDQRWRIVNESRNAFANGVRPNLVWS